MADQVRLDDAKKVFEIKCLKCGSTDVEIDDNRACGSSWTGPYGSLDLVCKNCGAEETVIDT